jgi:hypothetical protein
MGERMQGVRQERVPRGIREAIPANGSLRDM